MAAPSSARLLTPRSAAALLGVALLAGWVCLWAVSIPQGRMAGRGHYWFDPFDYLGVDFAANYVVPRAWLAGADPYHDVALEPFGDHYTYAPAVIWMFAWAPLFSRHTAWLLWLAASCLIAAAGCWAAGRSRARLGLTQVPFPLILAAVFWSTPVLYALERGNCDLLVVGFLLLAVWGTSRRTFWGDVLTGAAVALAAWCKVYPGLLLLGLAACRNWRGLAGAVVAGVVILLIDVPGALAFKENLTDLVHKVAPGQHGVYFHSVHSLGEWWMVMVGRVHGLRRVPGAAAMVLILGPLVGWVSWRLYQCPRHGPLTFAYLTWLVAAATFVPAVANDYSLVFLPLAALAVWDRRDPAPVHMAMALLLLWWQPYLLSVGPMLLFVFKLLGLAAVGVSIARRARELSVGVAAAQPEAPPALAA